MVQCALMLTFFYDVFECFLCFCEKAATREQQRRTYLWVLKVSWEPSGKLPGYCKITPEQHQKITGYFT